MVPCPQVGQPAGPSLGTVSPPLGGHRAVAAFLPSFSLCPMFLLHPQGLCPGVFPRSPAHRSPAQGPLYRNLPCPGGQLQNKGASGCWDTSRVLLHPLESPPPPVGTLDSRGSPRSILWQLDCAKGRGTGAAQAGAQELSTDDSATRGQHTLTPDP